MALDYSEHLLRPNIVSIFQAIGGISEKVLARLPSNLPKEQANKKIFWAFED